MRADELLEGGDLVHLRVVGAIDHDVSNVLKAIRAPDVPGGVRAEWRQRILPFHPVLIKVMRSLSANRHSPMPLGAH